jgi:hypothetical protein
MSRWANTHRHGGGYSKHAQHSTPVKQPGLILYCRLLLAGGVKRPFTQKEEK